MFVALLGILKSGAPYLPLNAEHPRARLEHQLHECGVRVIVSQTALADRLPEPEAALVCIDGDEAAIAAGRTTPPEVATGPEDLAYVMYTSGSTGTPKGVQVTHGNLAAYTLGIIERLGIEEDPELRFGLVSAISTDLGNTAIFPTLASGGCVQVFSEAAITDSASLAGELGGEHLDALKITPSHLRALLGDDAAAALPRRWLLVGGEALSWDLAGRVRELAARLSAGQSLRPDRGDHRLPDARRGERSAQRCGHGADRHAAARGDGVRARCTARAAARRGAR